MNLLKTITAKCTRYYVNSRRVSPDAYERAQFRKTLSCLQTVVTGDTVRHYSVASSR